MSNTLEQIAAQMEDKAQDYFNVSQDADERGGEGEEDAKYWGKMWRAYDSQAASIRKGHYSLEDAQKALDSMPEAA